MRKVFKYPLDLRNLSADDHLNVETPVGAKPLCVQVQNGMPTLWCEVDDEENSYENRKVFVHGTGHPIRIDATEYIGTFQLHGGSLVFHVFTEK